ncbi:hypothetical protein ACLK1Y_20565 [Escherichia coli]
MKPKHPEGVFLLATPIKCGEKNHFQVLVFLLFLDSPPERLDWGMAQKAKVRQLLQSGKLVLPILAMGGYNPEKGCFMPVTRRTHYEKMF